MTDPNPEKQALLQEISHMREQSLKDRARKAEQQAKETEQFTLDVLIILDDIRKMLQAKRQTYGPNNLDTYGELGIAVRASDKLARIAYILQHPENEPADETINDTWRDLAGYAILALIMRSTNR